MVALLTQAPRKQVFLKAVWTDLPRLSQVMALVRVWVWE
jgi:hypothetical protein